jgi:hypothetical protein
VRDFELDAVSDKLYAICAASETATLHVARSRLV